MLQFATHEIGRFHEVFKQFGQLFWESGGLLESLKTSLSHKNNHFAKAYKHAESILKWKLSMLQFATHEIGRFPWGI
jgi:hypothetical protein